MKNYLQEEVYLLNEDGDKVYRIESINSFNNGSLINYLNLILICGKEYPNDEKHRTFYKEQWCDKSYFIEDVQEVSIHFNMMYESIESVLEDEGLQKLDNKPFKIYD